MKKRGKKESASSAWISTCIGAKMLTVIVKIIEIKIFLDWSFQKALKRYNPVKKKKIKGYIFYLMAITSI